jgi:hypothetical protein
MVWLLATQPTLTLLNKKITMDSKVKEEIEIGVNISKLLLQYQQGEFDFDTFVEKSIVEARKSYYADIDGFTDFIKSQQNNTLNNKSSGSTLTAVLDLDGLYDLIIEDEEIEQYDELYDDMRAYQQFILQRNGVM